MFITETEMRVRYAETDQMGVVYHSNFFLYFESARAESIRQLGFTYAGMEKMGIVMPVVDVHCKYLRPAVYDDLLTIKTMLKELLAVGKVILYFMEAKTMKRTTMPTQLLEKLQPYFN